MWKMYMQCVNLLYLISAVETHLNGDENEYTAKWSLITFKEQSLPRMYSLVSSSLHPDNMTVSQFGELSQRDLHSFTKTETQAGLESVPNDTGYTRLNDRGGVWLLYCMFPTASTCECMALSLLATRHWPFNQCFTMHTHTMPTPALYIHNSTL